MGALCILLAGWVYERAELVSFTESLAKLRAEFRTIEIDFTLERKDAVFKRSGEFTGKLRMLREQDGAVYGLLEIGSVLVPEDKTTYVLRGDELHEWDGLGKTIRKLSVTEAGVLDYTARNAWGAVWLLDRAEASKKCEVSRWKRDEHYTYFTIKAEEYQVFSFRDGEPRKFTREYRFAVAAHATREFPRNAVRQIVMTQPNGDAEVVRVTRWVIDA